MITIKTMQILLSTEFKIGDVVFPIVNEYYDEDTHSFYVVCGYDISGIDESGQVINYVVKVIGQGGEVLYFPPEAINKKPV